MIHKPSPTNAWTIHPQNQKFSVQGNRIVLRFKTLSGVALSVPELPFPNCPLSFFPQHFALWLLRRAQVWKLPALIAFTWLSPETETGVSASILDPFPNCPSPFPPQHFKLSSLRMAHVWKVQALMDLTGPRPFTATGIELLAVPEFPSCPEELYPQHMADPLSSTAQVWFALELIDLNWSMLTTWVGEVMFAPV